jgi:hypothetical protein
MARTLMLRPAAGTDPTTRSRSRTTGLILGLVGLSAAAVVLIAGLVAGGLSDDADQATTVARIGAWTFGLTPLAFATVKIAIAVILSGILVRIWMRVDAVRSSLPELIRRPADDRAPAGVGRVTTPYGAATVSTGAPAPLLIHRIAKVLWAPMLAMGAMAVAAGFVVSLVQADRVGADPRLATQLSAWVQGLQFLGEGFLLSGISFLLGTILYALRTGGGEVQSTLGAPVKTLGMPLTAKLFVALMAAGMMVEMFQFVVYLITTTFSDATTIASYFAWLGPVREAGLGLLLGGIVLALAAIARVLGFQFWRIKELIATGR